MSWLSEIIRRPEKILSLPEKIFEPAADVFEISLEIPEQTFKVSKEITEGVAELSGEITGAVVDISKMTGDLAMGSLPQIVEKFLPLANVMGQDFGGILSRLGGSGPSYTTSMSTVGGGPSMTEDERLWREATEQTQADGTKLMIYAGGAYLAWYYLS